ncbi:ANTAR domain-containing protein [Prauserella muralis]|uniref:Uncharacterized protein n=1 Tax=Prauserella muralis TaxID=588067 RepID=A0A2V4BB05_9PSEU|nr:ANTAR domain-containing protein [Prauserella muralis]PXY26909.1 hypothetical protein BAY60_10415 [Prauserella muralis]TWE23481.1 response regulator receiver and ANTAR domain protein [Prauserella muralis]
MDKREHWLNETLAELADCLDADADERDIAGTVTGALAALLAPADVGLRFFGDEGAAAPAPAASSSPRVAGLFDLETETGEGPTLWSFRGGLAAVDERLTELAGRWPRFAPAARERGYARVTAIPLQGPGGRLGAAGVLAPSGAPTGEAELRCARTVLRVTAGDVLRRRELDASHRVTSQLQQALDSRVVIEQAKGVLSARLGVSPAAAFERLRGYARRHGLPLAEAAGAAVDGALPVSALVTERRPG